MSEVKPLPKMTRVQQEAALAYRDLALSEARKTWLRCGRRIDLDEIEAAAYYGLCYAAARWNPERCPTLGAYARKWIQEQCWDLLRERLHLEFDPKRDDAEVDPPELTRADADEIAQTIRQFPKLVQQIARLWAQDLTDEQVQERLCCCAGSLHSARLFLREALEPWGYSGALRLSAAGYARATQILLKRVNAHAQAGRLPAERERGAWSIRAGVARPLPSPIVTSSRRTSRPGSRPVTRRHLARELRLGQGLSLSEVATCLGLTRCGVKYLQRTDRVGK